MRLSPTIAENPPKVLGAAEDAFLLVGPRAADDRRGTILLHGPVDAVLDARETAAIYGFRPSAPAAIRDESPATTSTGDARR